MNANASGEGSGYDAGPYLPSADDAPSDLDAHRRAAAGCRGCPLYGPATQTVFGRGSPSARVVLVGEQPGDREDRQGEPFVGPAGRLLDRALEEAGLGDEPAYVTHAVKHFKFVPAERGKRRIHQAPSLRETAACRPWLTAELRIVDPDLTIALGATAARALLGSSFRVTKGRGTPFPLPSPPGGTVLATVHPSAVLRADDRDTAFADLVSDLRVAARLLPNP
jgi:uracil-DNA glycosylase